MGREGVISIACKDTHGCKEGTGRWRESEEGKGSDGIYHVAGKTPLRPSEKRKLLTSGYQTTIRMLFYDNRWSVSVGSQQP